MPNTFSSDPTNWPLYPQKPETSGVDRAIEVLNQLNDAWTKVVGAYQIYYTPPSQQYLLSEVQHRQTILLIALQQLAGELAALEAQSEAEDAPLDQDAVRAMVISAGSYLRGVGADGFNVEEATHSTHLRVYEKSQPTAPPPGEEWTIQYGTDLLRARLGDVAEVAEKMGAGQASLDVGEYEVTVRKRQPGKPSGGFNYSKHVPESPVISVSTPGPLFINNGAQDALDSIYSSSQQLTVDQLQEALDKMWAWGKQSPQQPQKEYTFGTAVSPTQFLPMSPAPTEPDPGWLSGVDPALVADYVNLATPVKLVYPTYTPLKPLVAQKKPYVYQTSIQQLMNDPMVINLTQQDLPASGQLLTIGYAGANGTYQENDVIQVDGEPYTVAKVTYTDMAYGYASTTLALVSVAEQVKKTTEKMQPVVDAMKEFQQAFKPKEPWYAQYNKPKKGKK